MLIQFGKWFVSSRGVWQTLFLVGTVCLIEQIYPGADPHGFWLLYWLTVYSAVTQPALAFVNDRAALRTAGQLNEELTLLREEVSLTKEELALLREENELLKRVAGALGVL